jgi:hypothetical protein
MTTKMKRVKGPDDVPIGPHFAVIIYGKRSIYIEGDERSRTAPGHGYPAHTERFDDIEHWVTTERAVLDEFVSVQEMATGLNKKPYVVIEVTKKGGVQHNTSVTF